MRTYSVRQLATLAGVSVRTLHHYDRLRLLSPLTRTEARYRLYGELELLRLQQILFYKELGFPLAEIQRILTDPDFNAVTALQQHRHALENRRDQLSTLLETIDKTVSKLKGEQNMMTDQELYEGFPTGQGEAYRREAVADYGESVVAESEQKLRKMGKADFAKLTAEGTAIARTLAGLTHLAPGSDAVQQQVARHYANIQQFWGESVCASRNMADAYKGLAGLYTTDLRFTASYLGHEDADFAAFFSKAMIHFADATLRA